MLTKQARETLSAHGYYPNLLKIAETYEATLVCPKCGLHDKLVTSNIRDREGTGYRHRLHSDCIRCSPNPNGKWYGVAGDGGVWIEHIGQRAPPMLPDAVAVWRKGSWLRRLLFWRKRNETQGSKTL